VKNQQHPLVSLLGDLSSAEQQEFIDAVDYLTEKGADGQVPEGSITKVLASLSPRVRNTFALLNEALDTPRVAPFATKRSEAEKAAVLGFDPEVTQQVKGRLDQETVTAGLQSRLGTDRDLPQEPLSRRDVIAAALEAHGGE